MKIVWKIGKREAMDIAQFIKSRESSAFVEQRLFRNVNGHRPTRTKTWVWSVLVTCLLTTQQRSGPQSKVQAFSSSKPFPLRYSLIRSQNDISKFVAEVLRDFGGLRRVDTIGRELAENAKWFEGRLWKELSGQLDICGDSEDYLQERKVARWVAQEFRGLGPKQSRNFLQCLGLTRFEIPIDSRITKWLNSVGFPVELSGVALSDPNYYEFVSDGVREIASAAGVLPCILDAAVFSAVDGDGWDEVELIF
jgi:thermostable 8-oxoguanine DNA glycosylase